MELDFVVEEVAHPRLAFCYGRAPLSPLLTFVKAHASYEISGGDCTFTLATEASAVTVNASRHCEGHLMIPASLSIATPIDSLSSASIVADSNVFDLPVKPSFVDVLKKLSHSISSSMHSFLNMPTEKRRICGYSH
ncbi:hypothetical protein Q3G72_014983 [Acer saccharum]|nr:hypothetical protein Q3G72_014983 [Acer saccharum]